MSDPSRFEVASAGELREKYGLRAENRPKIVLNPTNVPEPLRLLIRLAEKFGISDDLIRADFIRKTPQGELEELSRTVREFDDLLDEWLTGPAAAGPTYSPEYLAFTCMRMAADGC
jgi:hypothetical protein